MNECSIEDCYKPIKAKMVCAMHLSRWRRTGSPRTEPKRDYHGFSRLPEYAVWSSMKSRCNNPSVEMYQYYGGRGVRVYEGWLNSFRKFYEDVGPRPSEDHWIDRIDSSGNYEPGNVRWLKKEDQMNNRRSNLIFDWNNKKLTLTQIARLEGVNISRTRKRIKLGWSIKEAVYGKGDK